MWNSPASRLSKAIQIILDLKLAVMGRKRYYKNTRVWNPFLPITRVEFLFVHSLSCRITQKYMHFLFSGKKMNGQIRHKNSTVYYIQMQVFKKWKIVIASSNNNGMLIGNAFLLCCHVTCPAVCPALSPVSCPAMGQHLRGRTRQGWFGNM